jgi:hypothetical protein
MTRRLALLISLLSLPSFATPRLLEPSDVQFGDDQTSSTLKLADYHGAAPVSGPRPYSPVVRHVQTDFFLLGLGLAAGGLVLGGAGFAVLYVCREGTACYGDVTQVIGWVLAAPGLIPLGIGLIMMYASSGSSVRVSAPVNTAGRWALGVAPLRDGALFSAATSF